jgi:hypothetical protein
MQIVVDWINLTEDRHNWRALVNTVMNLRITDKRRAFLNHLCVCQRLENCVLWRWICVSSNTYQ